MARFSFGLSGSCSIGDHMDMRYVTCALLALASVCGIAATWYSRTHIDRIRPLHAASFGLYLAAVVTIALGH